MRQQNTYDILGTRTTGLIGDIGETIAWRYLYERGIYATSLGARRTPDGPLASDLLLSGGLEGHLTREQIDFIFPPVEDQAVLDWIKNSGLSEEQVRSMYRLSWDFVGWQRVAGKACLVEVKTCRPGIRPDALRQQGRRGLSDEELRDAARLGFVLLLVTVELTEELTDAWKAIVCDQEIQADG